LASYLVTGAAGFIGSAIAKRLLDAGHRVVSIDNLSTGSEENLPAGIEFIKGDCQDPVLYRRIDTPFDAIFHVAGQSSGEISFDDPIYDLRTNTESTLQLLELARRTDCRRFIYAGTMSVYGDRGDRAVSEEESCNPRSFYGVGKLASEHYLRLYGLQYGIESTSLRLFNVYGPGQNMENLRQGMVSIFMAQMLENGHILVKGSPDRFRDFVYIEDVVDAFLACLERSESIGENINIGTGVRTTVGELLDKMVEIYGRKVDIEFQGNTAGDIHGIYADNTVMRQVLGFAPRYMLDDGLRLMLKGCQR
jgi:UDP-glucose 4-epimerase